MSLRTALVAVVPEVEPLVGPVRRRLDPLAPIGVPPHITVLFPFVPVAELTAAIHARVAEVVRPVAPITHRYDGVRWFDEDVLWLSTDAAATFGELTRRVWAAFPDHPPYSGEFGDAIVPHLTIADRAPVARMRAAERAVSADLPVAATTRELTLLAEDADRRWTVAATYPLLGRPD